MRFEWDPAKAALNQRRHSVSFDEAQTVFFDDEAMLYHDPDHSEGEARFLLLGMSQRARVLIVVHCLRGQEERIRLISARPATKSENKNYWEHRR